MGSAQSEWARRRAELLWQQHTSAATTAQTASKSGRSAADLKTARLRKLRLAQGAVNAAQVSAPLDAKWLEYYGKHLRRLFEPAAQLPPDLHRLVSAIAAAQDDDDWPDIF